MTPIIGVGAGGHASVMIALAESCWYKVVGLWASQYGRSDPQLLPPLMVNLQQCRRLASHAFVGLGSTDAQTAAGRAGAYTTLLAADFSIPALIHAEAIVPPEAWLVAGLTVLASAVVCVNVTLGENVLINTGAIVEHGCTLGNHVHVASRAVLGGDVTVGEASHIGIGAVIRQGITIGKHACVGAGAVVVKDVPDGVTVVGNPARGLR